MNHERHARAVTHLPSCDIAVDGTVASGISDLYNGAVDAAGRTDREELRELLVENQLQLRLLDHLEDVWVAQAVCQLKGLQVHLKSDAAEHQGAGGCTVRGSGLKRLAPRSAGVLWTGLIQEQVGRTGLHGAKAKHFGSCRS